MDIVIHILASIPNVIWSAVIASCLTMLGVMWINRGYAQRQRELLAHEERKFQLEQNMALKKEVFLEMVAAFSRGLGTFLKLMNLEIPLEDIKENTRDPDETAVKTLLIANEQTVTELLEYTADFLEAFLTLSKKRNSLIERKKTINAYNDSIVNANTEKDRLLQLLDNAIYRNIKDTTSMEHIENSYKLQEESAANTGSRLEQENIEFQPLYKDFINECMAEYARLRVAMVPMMAAIRNELDNAIDYEAFENIMQESISRIASTVNNMVLEDKNQE